MRTFYTVSKTKLDSEAKQRPIKAINASDIGLSELLHTVELWHITNTAELDITQLKRLLHRARVELATSEALAGTPYIATGEIRHWQIEVASLDQALEAKLRAQPSRSGTYGHDANEIKTRLDIVAYIERYTTLRRAGTRFYGKCPLHADKNASLCVYSDKQDYYCFGCGSGGDIIRFTMALHKVEFREALSILSEVRG